MRWVFVSYVLMPTLLFAKQLMLNIPATYPLNVVNAQLICSSLHSNLSTAALSKLETRSHTPFVCEINPNDSKQLLIIFSLQ